MRWGWRWTLIVVAAGAVDFVTRIVTGFDMARVVPAEAVLFLGTALVLWTFLRREPAVARWQLRVQQVLVVAFALAGARAALWAAGLPVATANVVVGLAGVGLLAFALVRHRRAHSAD